MQSIEFFIVMMALQDDNHRTHIMPQAGMDSHFVSQSICASYYGTCATLLFSNVWIDYTFQARIDWYCTQYFAL